MWFDISAAKKEKMREMAEGIRVSAGSPSEVVTGFVQMMKECGVDLVFSEYPSVFDECCSNSHRSPIGYPTNWCSMTSTKPRGYPGFRGTWRGTFVITDKVKFGRVRRGTHVALSDLKEVIPWLSTGGGGGVEEFNFEGTIWIYDFPKMKAEYEMNGGIFKDKNREFNDLLTAYRAKYKEALLAEVENNQDVMDLQDRVKTLTDVLEEVQDVLSRKTRAIESDFHRTYSIPLPTPESAFQSTTELMRTGTVTSAGLHPECKDIFKAMNKALKDLHQYKKDNPELFI